MVAYEDNPWWLGRAREMVADAGLDNVEIRERPITAYADELAALPDESLDLLVIDFLESPEAERIDAVRAGMPKVRPGGLLLLDDSDRPSYAGRLRAARAAGASAASRASRTSGRRRAKLRYSGGPDERSTRRHLKDGSSLSSTTSSSRMGGSRPC